MSNERKARKSISNDVKLASVIALKKKEKTQQQIAAELNMTQSTVSGWMPKKAKLEDRVAAGQGKNKTMHQDQYPIVSKAPLAYLTARSNLNAPLPGLTSYSLMIEKCKSLAAALVAQGDKHYTDLKASPGWLRDVMLRTREASRFV